MSPTEQQVTAAHDAWEQTVREWTLRRVSNYGLAHDMWVVERSMNSGGPVDGPIIDPVYGHKFDGPTAEQSARFCLRDKCIKAALKAALSI